MNSDEIKPFSKVAVLHGGSSSEREISLITGKAVFKSLQLKGIKAILIDTIEPFIEVLKTEEVSHAWIALHGSDGEDGKIQGLLESEGIPYTHSGVYSSSSAMNKAFSKELFKKNNIKTPSYKIIKINELRKIKYKNPFVIKPINEGSSKGVYVILNESGMNNLIDIQNTWVYGDKVLIEDYIKGKEITCSVNGNQVTEVMEIFTNTDFYDYEAKYTNGASEHIIPAKIPSSISKLVQEISLKAHKIFKCKGVTRSDFRFDENFGSDGLFILEINTQPGMTSTSLVPELFSRIGFSFNDLVISLLEDASCNR